MTCGSLIIRMPLPDKCRHGIPFEAARIEPNMACEDCREVDRERRWQDRETIYAERRLRERRGDE